jgi:hypothetical protein
MAAVSVVNLTIQKSTYFEETFSLTAEDGLGLNLNNITATSKLRKHPTAGIAYTFSTTVTVVDSSIKISMTSDKTAQLPSGRCYYDVITTSPGNVVTKVLEGNAFVEETASI